MEGDHSHFRPLVPIRITIDRASDALTILDSVAGRIGRARLGRGGRGLDAGR